MAVLEEQHRGGMKVFGKKSKRECMLNKGRGGGGWKRGWLYVRDGDYEVWQVWIAGRRGERGENSDRMGLLVLLQDLFRRYGSFELRW
jgi:hypothetical protein